MPHFLRVALGRRRSYTVSTLVTLLSTPIALCAQHERHPPTKPDSARVDSTKRRTAPRDTSMADMPRVSADSEPMADMMEGPLGISHARMGSGTSWMPDSSPMHANHKMWGDWNVMLHGVAFGQYDDQGSNRGDKQLGIIDWEMLMAMRRVGMGMFHLHGMVSLEPATIGPIGYPLLLQTGESYKGQPLHDRQHPHDFIMELAALFQQPIGRKLAVELYGGPAGEPALGPVAFMHRPSAENDPLAPLGHHWQDATHISYGVLTAGLYSRQWKLEGSWFNGREPDENRWNNDLRGLDSYSGRLTVNPTGQLSVAGWYGYLPSPEQLYPDESVHRYGASALYGGRGIAGGAWESSLIWGANEHAGVAENSVIVETNLEIGRKNAVFGRAEYVRKSAQDLVLPNVNPEQQFDIRSLVGGYMREIGSIPGGSIGLGGRVSVNFISPALASFYGTRTPAGIDVYIRVRPKRMATETMHGMPMAPSKPAMRMPGDTARSSMPGMTLPGRTPPAGKPMTMPADSMRDMPRDTSARRPTQDMRSMPGTVMPDDSARVRRDSASSAPMAHMHDAPAKAPAQMPGSMPGMKMPHADTAAATKGVRSRTGNKGAAATGRNATKPRRGSDSVKAAKKRPKSSKPQPPGKHQMPGMQRMPGMKMPNDSSPRRKP